jgi:hypothetical protein
MVIGQYDRRSIGDVTSFRSVAHRPITKHYGMRITACVAAKRSFFFFSWLTVPSACIRPRQCALTTITLLQTHKRPDYWPGPHRSHVSISERRK